MSAGGMQAGVGGATVTAGKITTDNVINTSTVPGATATDALDSLSGSIGALTTDDVANASGVAGATCSDALDTLASSIAGLGTDAIANQSGVAGASCSDALDTLASSIAGLGTDAIANQSGVAGASCSDALDTLASSIAGLGTDAIANQSGVAGTSCSDALDTLNARGFVVQTMEIARSTSTSTGSSSYVSLLSGSITLTAGMFLCFNATLGAIISGIVLGSGNVLMEIRFNGTTYRSCGQSTPGNDRLSIAITGRVAVGSSGLVVGSNTIELRWRSLNGTVNCNPATDGQHAAIQLMEMSA